ncbi:MAG: pentapeptide repeat-containing protein [Saprospiraceae bacterium]|nr:pentapeptide repeat-containing protein [Saprospiraceae bacterium]
MDLIEGQEFRKLNGETFPGPSEFDNCHFDDCMLQNADLSRSNFIECRFSHSDLSNASLDATSFQKTIFQDCQLLGLHLFNCNTINFEVDFINCLLDLSVFQEMNLKRSRFKDCRLTGVDFTAADLSGVNLEQCNLQNAVFERSILIKTDFTTARHITLDPEVNTLTGAKFSEQGALNLLNKYQVEIIPDII